MASSPRQESSRSRGSFSSSESHPSQTPPTSQSESLSDMPTTPTSADTGSLRLPSVFLKPKTASASPTPKEGTQVATKTGIIEKLRRNLFQHLRWKPKNGATEEGDNGKALKAEKSGLDANDATPLKKAPAPVTEYAADKASLRSSLVTKFPPRDKDAMRSAQGAHSMRHNPTSPVRRPIPRSSSQPHLAAAARNGQRNSTSNPQHAGYMKSRPTHRDKFRTHQPSSQIFDVPEDRPLPLRRASSQSFYATPRGAASDVSMMSSRSSRPHSRDMSLNRQMVHPANSFAQTSVSPFVIHGYREPFAYAPSVSLLQPVGPTLVNTYDYSLNMELYDHHQQVYNMGIPPQMYHHHRERNNSVPVNYYPEIMGTPALRSPYRSASSSDLFSLSARQAQQGRVRHQRSVSSESIDYQMFLAQGGRLSTQLRRQPSRSSTWSQKTMDDAVYTRRQFAKPPVAKSSASISEVTSRSRADDRAVGTRQPARSPGESACDGSSPQTSSDESGYIPVTGSEALKYGGDAVPRIMRKPSFSPRKLNRPSSRVGFRGEATIMEDVFAADDFYSPHAPHQNAVQGRHFTAMVA